MVLGDAHRPILTSTSDDNDGPTHLADLHLPSPASLSAVTREGGGPNMQPGCKKMCVSLHYMYCPELS